MIIRLFCPFSSGELACRGRGRDEVVTDLLRTTIRHYKQDCPPLSSGELACRGRGRDEVVTDLLRTTIRHYKQDCPPLSSGELACRGRGRDEVKHCISLNNGFYSHYYIQLRRSGI